MEKKRLSDERLDELRKTYREKAEHNENSFVKVSDVGEVVDALDELKERRDARKRWLD